MSETEFVLFQNIIGGIETFLYAVCITAFFYPFITEKRERSMSKSKKILMVFLAYFLIYIIGTEISIYNWICMLVVIVLLLVACSFLGIDKKVCFLLSVFFFCIRDICKLILESLNFLLSNQFVSGRVDENIILRNTAAAYSFTILLTFIFLAFMLYLVKRRLLKEQLRLHIKEVCYMGLLPIVGILFVNVIWRVFLIIQGNAVFILYEQYPSFVGVVPLISILFYVGIIITIMSYQEMVKLQEEKKKYFVEEQQVHAIQERMEEVEQFYNGIRQMKHEMRNHLTNIKGLLESGNYEDMQQYLFKMDESMNVFEMTIQTGNAVTDVIVNDKQKAASKQGIQFQAEFSYPVSDRYDAYDIGIIINNLLQNALEACENMKAGERYITLSGRQKRKFFLIEVRNSFDGEIEFDSYTNLPISNKEKDISLHGIGLSNVKREVEKYMGDIDIKVKKNEFSVTVLLQERSDHE